MSTTLTIRNLDETVKQKLRLRATEHGRSIEAEALDILTHSVETIEPNPKPRVINFDRVRGLWKGQGSTNELMRELRGDDWGIHP